MEYEYKDLLNKAKNVSKNAYAPYSKFKVGAIVVWESGNIYSGCNIENVSYGLSLCAERNAISTAIASGENTKLDSIIVYSPNQKRCMPCGACRQWIAEFATEKTKVIVEGENGEPVIIPLKELFPYAFSIEE